MSEVSRGELTVANAQLLVGYIEEREILDRKIGNAYSTWYTSYGRAADIAKANAIARSVVEIPGIELIEPGDYATDYHNRCLQYAFGTCKGEPWAMPNEDDSEHRDLWAHPLGFLQAKGYELVTVPLAGDIVAYTQSDEDDLREGYGSFDHFGILQDDGRVVSKFAQGPVVRHPIELVPTGFGDKVYYFRKSEQD